MCVPSFGLSTKLQFHKGRGYVLFAQEFLVSRGVDLRSRGGIRLCRLPALETSPRRAVGVTLLPEESMGRKDEESPRPGMERREGAQPQTQRPRERQGHPFPLSFCFYFLPYEISQFRLGYTEHMAVT